MLFPLEVSLLAIDEVSQPDNDPAMEKSKLNLKNPYKKEDDKEEKHEIDR